MSLILDHLVFGTSDLAFGTQWMAERLGCPPTGGGHHPDMSTHNALWRLGDAYLEVIAVDPDAPPVPHARWYGLDQLGHQKVPRFLTWVVRGAPMSVMQENSDGLSGPARRFRRDTLYWDLTVPMDGVCPMGGQFPALIEWPATVMPPSATLPEQGLALHGLRASGADGDLTGALDRLGASHLMMVHRDGPRALHARIATAAGEVEF